MSRFGDWREGRRHRGGGQREAKLTPDDVLVRELVPWVAEVIQDDPVTDDTDPFDERAREAAKRLGPGGLRALSRHIFHYFPAETKAGLRLEREERFGVWPDACREALFTILYHLGPVCLPFVRQVAFGEYDWTQIDAIRVLCRFGQDGVERDQIAQELADHLLVWDWDDVTRFALEPLCQFVSLAPPLLAVFDRMVLDEAPYSSGVEAQRVPYSPDADRMTLLTGLFRFAPEVSRRYESTLREFLRHTGRTPSEEALDYIAAQETQNRKAKEAGDEEEGSSSSLLDDIDHNAIQAAFILVSLFPGDPEAMTDLRVWRENHPSWRVRQQLAKHISDIEKRAS